jgi:hypothetical protein
MSKLKMKATSLSLIALFLVGFAGYAQDKEAIKYGYDFKSGSIITSYNKEIIEYKFQSVSDLAEGIDEVIKGIDFNDPENEKQECLITIELKLEAGLGISKALISEVIKTNCFDVSSEVELQKLKELIIAVTM